MPYSSPRPSGAKTPFPLDSESTEGGPTKTDPIAMSNSRRDDALKEVKEILSTSPQLSTSPRRKFSPEAIARRLSLKVDLPYTNMTRESVILRRKNGDVVKPSLKRTKSEPATPVCPKYVHFGTDLEQIKFFLQFEKPKAVSAEASSDEESSEDDMDDDDELPFSASEDEVVEERKLVISLPNFPRITTLHSQKEVFVDSVSLSADGRQLNGLVQVANIAFHKTVTVRYTFDFWQSCSEVSAKYSDKSMKRRDTNFDVFAFSVDLVDNKRNPIDKKTMLFAVRYSVDNREIWDNNSGSNYQVNFRRVLQAPYTPRRKSRRNTGWPRQHRVDRDNVYRSQPSFASSPPSLISSHNRTISSKGQYSITESLSAEMTKPPSTILSIQDRPQSTTTLRYPSASFLYGSPTFSHTLDFNPFFPGQFVDGMPGTVDRFQPWGTEGKPIERSAPMAIPMGPSKPAIGSSSYYELVDRYCFYHGSPCSTSPHALTGSPPIITQ